MALTAETAIIPRSLGGQDNGLADKRRQEARYQELKRENAQLREQVQQWMMLIDAKFQQRDAQAAAAQDDRIPDLMARVARLETARKPGRPPKQAQQGG